MEDQSCPRCKTTKYRNPNLKLMVNVCGHSLCENCVELLFVRGSGACPQCNVPLRRTNFRLQLFEDAYVEKEVDIRKRILKDYNKKEEDFNSLREYNDYLEEIETIVFNLANGIDIDETKQRIEQYKKENRDFIKKNKVKISKDEEYLDSLIEQEKLTSQNRRLQILEEERLLKNKKMKKEALIDELMFSDLPAESILATHKAAAIDSKDSIPVHTEFSTGIKVGQSNIFKPIPKPGVIPLYSYEPQLLENCGPVLPSLDDMDDKGYSTAMSAKEETIQIYKAGGFQMKSACHRALQEALCGLFFNCDLSNPSPAPSGCSSSGNNSEFADNMDIS
ncbi:CDK-activating kinase assembly factor MAT1-like [Tubulanus polymorphus]|uniref:CDK-activating kinase assembly factor MAT1-like n=1 Tax=Tubulanus polymorphus TaxID=672921 RepID=UPI003DA2F557